MKTARITLNVIAILLLVYQILGYIGNRNKKFDLNGDIGDVAFYVGFNLPLIIAFILFLIARYLKKKMRKKEESEILDSLGN